MASLAAALYTQHKDAAALQAQQQQAAQLHARQLYAAQLHAWATEDAGRVEAVRQLAVAPLTLHPVLYELLTTGQVLT